MADPGTAAVVVALIIVVALTVYLLTGGADFGGGAVWLVARGPHAAALRELVLKAIGPIWEAHHVWLIVVVVLLFVCFPLVFATLTTALHIPLTLVLIGIVLRGAAFVFRAYGLPRAEFRQRWEVIFAVASLMTPLMLGVTLGAVTSGRIRVDPVTGGVVADYVTTWWQPFPWAVGLLLVGLCMYLAVVYLLHETAEPALREVLRRIGVVVGIDVGLFAWLAAYLAADGAPQLYHGLMHARWSLGFQFVTGGVAVGALVALWQRRYAVARVVVVAQAVCMVGGWAASQFPWLIVPDLTIANSAAPANVLQSVLWVLGGGAVLLGPAFGYLYYLFKWQREQYDGRTREGGRAGAAPPPSRSIL
ncbi:MAG: cytochrome d ubiquinol oxidase subunit II [Deltaproteobacteria bacterium]|nr:cytochrome d ubiquinol oxidase subunit II [Deltaproteobacteria bacterium]